MIYPQDSYRHVGITNTSVYLSKYTLISLTIKYVGSNVQITTSNVTGHHRGLKLSTCLFVGTWQPLVSVITTLYYAALNIFIVECGIARFLCAMHSQSSGIILIP